MADCLSRGRHGTERLIAQARVSQRNKGESGLIDNCVDCTHSYEIVPLPFLAEGFHYLGGRIP